VITGFDCSRVVKEAEVDVHQLGFSRLPATDLGVAGGTKEAYDVRRRLVLYRLTIGECEILGRHDRAGEKRRATRPLAYSAMAAVRFQRLSGYTKSHCAAMAPTRHFELGHNYSSLDLLA
jgi:hypothetical protein